MSLDYGYGPDEEREEAERADENSEHARELLHADAIRFCPLCDTEVLTKRDGSCVWCDGPSFPLTGGCSGPAPGFAFSSLTPGCPTVALRAPGAPGVRESTRGEEAA